MEIRRRSYCTRHPTIMAVRLHVEAANTLVICSNLAQPTVLMRTLLFLETAAAAAMRHLSCSHADETNLEN